jgi:hypothetical protein
MSPGQRDPAYKGRSDHNGPGALVGTFLMWSGILGVPEEE